MALEIVKNVVVYGVLLLCGVMCTYLPILLRFQIVIGLYVCIRNDDHHLTNDGHHHQCKNYDGHHHHPSLFISIYARAPILWVQWLHLHPQFFCIALKLYIYVYPFFFPDLKLYLCVHPRNLGQLAVSEYMHYAILFRN